MLNANEPSLECCAQTKEGVHSAFGHSWPSWMSWGGRQRRLGPGQKVMQTGWCLKLRIKSAGRPASNDPQLLLGSETGKSGCLCQYRISQLVLLTPFWRRNFYFHSITGEVRAVRLHFLQRHMGRYQEGLNCNLSLLPPSPSLALQTMLSPSSFPTYFVPPHPLMDGENGENWPSGPLSKFNPTDLLY